MKDLQLDEKKAYVDPKELHVWAENPKTIDQTQLERLKRNLERYGQRKALLIEKDGNVLGGNSTLQAVLQLGWTKVWASLVEPDNDADRFAIATIDNDQYGKPDEEKYAEMLSRFGAQLPLSDLQINISSPISLERMWAAYSPPPALDLSGREGDVDTTADKLETYKNNTIRQIVLYFEGEQYETMIAFCDSIMTDNDLHNNSEVFESLKGEYERHQSEES